MFVKTFFAAIATLMVLDLAWIGVIAKDFYAKYLGFLLRPDVNWIAAIAFYLIFTVALLVFVVNPAIAAHSWKHALIFGAFFGLVAYATYDLTNLATVKNWPLVLTIVDMFWGAVIAAIVSLVAYSVGTQ